MKQKWNVVCRRFLSCYLIKWLRAVLSQTSQGCLPRPHCKAYGCRPFDKFSLDREAAEDSHYEFVEEQNIRKKLYAAGDENKYFHEILLRYVQAYGGAALRGQILPYVTAQFHYYDYD